ncbi:MAG: SIMPL domain-containing protein [Aeromonadaceae bacterium]
MNERNIISAVLLGTLLCVGLATMGLLLSEGIIKFRDMERVVSVKGLSERDMPADVAIWPIRFTEVSNDLSELYGSLESKNDKVNNFLRQQGFKVDEISVSVPAIQDRQAQGFSEEQVRNGRYAGTSTLTVYSNDIEMVRKAMSNLAQLGQNGIAISGQDYDVKTQFLFTKLNDIKPAMIEEATRNAREVAEKFAHDSGSKLGKIKRASQGQFSIDDRDSNTPYIKKVRIVSTVEYYLVD